MDLKVREDGTGPCASLTNSKSYTEHLQHSRLECALRKSQIFFCPPRHQLSCALLLSGGLSEPYEGYACLRTGSVGLRMQGSSHPPSRQQWNCTLLLPRRISEPHQSHAHLHMSSMGVKWRDFLPHPPDATRAVLHCCPEDSDVFNAL